MVSEGHQPLTYVECATDCSCTAQQLTESDPEENAKKHGLHCREHFLKRVMQKKVTIDGRNSLMLLWFKMNATEKLK